ncbi:hypothetical protein ACTXT7_003780 [Hymenolepis weldensis]
MDSPFHPPFENERAARKHWRIGHCKPKDYLTTGRPLFPTVHPFWIDLDFGSVSLTTGEISRINNQLETREAEVADLSDCLARLSIEVKGQGARAEGLARQKAAQDAKLEEMRRELAAKDELLRAKSDELLRACLKHYEIEQELAFYKIDQKLGAVSGKPPDITAGLNENGVSTSEPIDLKTMSYLKGMKLIGQFSALVRHRRSRAMYKRTRVFLIAPSRNRILCVQCVNRDQARVHCDWPSPRPRNSSARIMDQ